MGVNIQVVVASESVQGIQTSRGEILLVIASAPLQSSWPAFDDLQGQLQVTDSSLLACGDTFYTLPPCIMSKNLRKNIHGQQLRSEKKREKWQHMHIQAEPVESFLPPRSFSYL